MIKLFKSKIFLFTTILFFLFFYIFQINKNKGIIIVETKNDQQKIDSSSSSTIFFDVEYKFSSKNGDIYYLKGKKASIEKNNPNLIYLNNVTAYTKLSDMSILKITSDNAKYFKNKNDIFFYKNVLFKNKDKTISSQNASFFMNTNSIEIFDNVKINDNKNIIIADKLIYDANTKNIEIKMYSTTKQIYGQRN